LLCARDGLTATRAIRQAEAIAAYKERQAQSVAAGTDYNSSLLLSPSSPVPESLATAAESASSLSPIPKASELTPTNHIPAHAHHIPIIAVTASALEEDANRCMESGFDDILHKPIILTLLSQKMLQIRQQKRRKLEAETTRQQKQQEEASVVAASTGKDEFKEAPADSTRSTSATI
jgi:CheY-like chemotaxis protein